MDAIRPPETAPIPLALRVLATRSQVEDLRENLRKAEAYDRDELIRHACRHFNDRKMDQALRYGYDVWRPAAPDGDPKFLDRISVNFLRHAASDYDDLLDETVGRTGVELAQRLIARRVYDAIAAAYPWLAGECEDQFGRKFPSPMAAVEPTP